MIRPGYYKGKDLFDRFEEGLLTKEEVVGFYKGNIIKYVTRYQDKNGIKKIEKATTYLERLKEYEQQKSTTIHLKKQERNYKNEEIILNSRCTSDWQNILD